MKKLMATAMVGFLAACGGGGDDDGGGDAAAGGDGGGGGADAPATADAGPATGANCADFPATLTSTPTISATQTGLVLCSGEDPALCRVTTNTFSDGEGACAVGTDVLFFGIDSSGATSRRVGLANQEDWTIVSTTHGTANDFGVDNLPDATQITIVLGYAKSTYAAIFEFQGQDVHFITFAEQI